MDAAVVAGLPPAIAPRGPWQPLWVSVHIIGSNTMNEKNALKFKIQDKGSLEFVTSHGSSAQIDSRVEIRSPTVYVMGLPTESGETQSVEFLFTDGSNKVEFNLGVQSARVLSAAIATLLSAREAAEEDYEPPLID